MHNLKECEYDGLNKQVKCVRQPEERKEPVAYEEHALKNSSQASKVLTSTPSLISSTTMLNLEPEYFDLVPTPEPPPFEKSFPSSLSTSLRRQ